MEKHRNADGTWNGIGVLGELSGLGANEVARIAGEVKANQEKLNGCQYHEFELHEQGPIVSRWKYRCKHCGGTINGQQHHWHELGRRPKP